MRGVREPERIVVFIVSGAPIQKWLVRTIVFNSIDYLLQMPVPVQFQYNTLQWHFVTSVILSSQVLHIYTPIVSCFLYIVAVWLRPYVQGARKCSVSANAYVGGFVAHTPSRYSRRRNDFSYGRTVPASALVVLRVPLEPNRSEPAAAPPSRTRGIEMGLRRSGQ